jgi:hypothetical protein
MQVADKKCMATSVQRKAKNYSTHSAMRLTLCLFLIFIITFFINRHLSFGLLLGGLTGNINFFILNKQIEIFVKNKKLYLIFISYIIRYFLMGLVLYFAIRKSTFLFIGVVIGFFIAQALFFIEKLKKY